MQKDWAGLCGWQVRFRGGVFQSVVLSDLGEQKTVLYRADAGLIPIGMVGREGGPNANQMRTR